MSYFILKIYNLNWKDSKQIFNISYKYNLRDFRSVLEWRFFLMGCHWEINLVYLLQSPLWMRRLYFPSGSLLRGLQCSKHTPSTTTALRYRGYSAALPWNRKHTNQEPVWRRARLDTIQTNPPILTHNFQGTPMHSNHLNFPLSIKISNFCTINCY